MRSKVPTRWTRRSQAGQALALTALMMPVLLGFVGFGVDFGRMAAQQRKLQDYADAGALSGAQDLVTSSSDDFSSRACTSAGTTLTANGNPASVSCGISKTGGSTTNNTITVTLTQSFPLDFMPVLGMSAQTLTAKARATNKSVTGCNDNGTGICAPYAAWRPASTTGCPDQWQVGMTVVIRDNGWSGTTGASSCSTWGTNSNNFKGYLRTSGDLYIGNTNSITTKGGNSCGQEPVSQIQTAYSNHENLVIPVIDSSSGNGSNINIDIPYFVTVSFDFTYPYENSAATASSQQSVTLNGPPTGGTFKLSYNGISTGDIPYNETAANLQSDLAALSPIGAGNVSVAGQDGGPYVITFGGTMSMSNLKAVTLVSNTLSGGTNPAVSIAQAETNSTKGGQPSAESDFACPATWWAKVVGTGVSSGQSVDTTGAGCKSTVAGTCVIGLLPCNAVDPCN